MAGQAAGIEMPVPGKPLPQPNRSRKVALRIMAVPVKWRRNFARTLVPRGGHCDKASTPRVYAIGRCLRASMLHAPGRIRTEAYAPPAGNFRSRRCARALFRRSNAPRHQCKGERSHKKKNPALVRPGSACCALTAGLAARRSAGLEGVGGKKRRPVPVFPRSGAHQTDMGLEHKNPAAPSAFMASNFSAHLAASGHPLPWCPGSPDTHCRP